MLKKILHDNIQIASEAVTWQEAIRLAAAPLLKKGFVTDGYVNEMIANVEKNGPYIVVIPNVAIPHAKPKAGVLKQGMSLLKLEKSVMFPEEQEVLVLIALAAKDADMHLDLMAELTDFLIDEEKLRHLLAARSDADILECL